MKALLTTLMVASVLVLGASLAYADPPTVTQLSDLDPVYIGLGASESSGNGSARGVWQEDSVSMIGVWGEADFVLNVSESHPGSVTNCWTYYDGTVYSGTSPTLSADDYRETYGCVIIKFSDDSFDYAGFSVLPAWPEEDEEHVGVLSNTPPSTPVLLPTGLPSEVQSVFTDVSEIDPSGPNQPSTLKVCVGEAESALCVEAVATRQECLSDQDCRNRSQ